VTRTLLIVASCVAALLAGASGCRSTGGCRSCKTPTASALPTQEAVVNAARGPAARYGGQRKCPVTGEELGSMGEPVAASLGERVVYVCCRGCVKRAEADPAKTLAAVEAERTAK
jgi:hypothetical protein